jgi:hypothetical protein
MLKQTKTFRLSYKDAATACGPGESVIDVLDTLVSEGIVSSYDLVFEIKLDKLKALAVEQFFFTKHYPKIEKERK